MVRQPLRDALTVLIRSYSSWYRIECVKKMHDYCLPVECQLPIRFVDPAKTSERTFIEMELFSDIKNFTATSILQGVTDESWNAYLKRLDTLKY